MDVRIEKKASDHETLEINYRRKNLKNIKSMELFDKFKKNKIEIKPFGKITKEDISEIEELFDVVLPNDYKKFLLKYNGGAVKLNEFNKLFLDDANETVSIDVLYGIHTDKKASDIEYWTNEYAEDLFEKTIIIGDSIQHGFIVLVCDGSDNGIWGEPVESEDKEDVWRLDESMMLFITYNDTGIVECCELICGTPLAPTNIPEDFSFSLVWNCYGISSYDSDEYGNGKVWIIDYEENNPCIIEMIDRDKINQMIILYWD